MGTSRACIGSIGGTLSDKPRLTGIEGVLRNSSSHVLALFSKHVGIMESNAISWVSSPSNVPWRFQFYWNGIFFFLASSLLGVVFRHVGRSVNGFADSLAKHGVERTRDLRM